MAKASGPGLGRGKVESELDFPHPSLCRLHSGPGSSQPLPESIISIPPPARPALGGLGKPPALSWTAREGWGGRKGVRKGRGIVGSLQGLVSLLGPGPNPGGSAPEPQPKTRIPKLRRLRTRAPHLALCSTPAAPAPTLPPTAVRTLARGHAGQLTPCPVPTLRSPGPGFRASLVQPGPAGTPDTGLALGWTC